MALAGLAVSDVKCHAVTSSDAWCEWHRCWKSNASPLLFYFFLTLVWPCLGLGLVVHNLMTYTEWRRNLFRMNFRKYYQLHTFLYTNVWPAVRFSTIWLPADVIIGVVFNGWSLTGALNSTLGLQTNEVPAPHFNLIFCVYYIYQLSWRRISSTRDCVWTMHQCLWLTLTLNQLY